jgi:prepilin-type N-terminal cleavage/methylation domain-containing protein
MRTSASCRRKARVGLRGFTLLELLVVMAVVGLLAAVVAPNLQRLVGSVDRATRRDGLVADIAGLSYRAYALGQSFELTADAPAQLLRDGNPVLTVPQGWLVTVSAPIRFGFDGLCSGGDITLRSPDGVTETFRLQAPDCRLVQG